MFDITIAVPVIIALTQAFKGIALQEKYAPFLSVAFGCVLFYFMGDSTITQNLFEGLVAGLTASGLYSGTKSVLK